MHLSSFGLITLKGSVTKLEPGLGFADYQVAMANHSATIALQSRLGKAQAPAPSLKPTTSPKLAPAPPVRDTTTDKELFQRPAFSAAAALVRKFRS